MIRPRRPRTVGEAVRRLRAESQPETLLAAVQAGWREAVGERVAAEAQPLRERDATVTVGCRAATWAQELDLLQGELLERVNATIAPRQVERLRFVVEAEPAPDTI